MTFIVVKTLVYGIDVPRYASIICIILFIGGLQLISLGVIGEYLGRVVIEDFSDNSSKEYKKMDETVVEITLKENEELLNGISK